MDPSHRPSLDRFLDPRSIAVIGASDRETSLGYRTMQNLMHFQGRLYPISRRLDRIDGRPCYSSVVDLPEPPDCAILAIPEAAVEEELTACAERGAGGCVVFASGYAELAGAEGSKRQQRLVSIARDAGMRLLGPNTTGFANFRTGAHAGFAEFPGGVPEGGTGIGLVSQSGALGLALAQSAEHGIAISHVLTCGNSADIDVAALISYLCGQEQARAIALLFEGTGSPERLVDAISQATDCGKPVAICRLGTTAAGAQSVRWHTGTDPHPSYDWDHRLASAGAMVGVAPERLIETAVFLSKTADLPRRMHAPRVAVLSSSGGSGILAADCLPSVGLALAEIAEETRSRLRAEMPPYGSPRNPCDVTAQATSDPLMMSRCADILLSDLSVDALIVPWGKAWDSGLFQAFSELSRSSGKPVCLVWMSQWLEGPGMLEANGTTHLSVFHSMKSCVSALAQAGSRHFTVEKP